ncbi:hypothetical protein SS1G_00772 [Sclerotinia sclerotiorum 1980 UF-70]|uniref:LysM domain-containing protein n=1 Tax=Sclerotinia sclerotiorum (strain ATCC 18683 / 1980 / Ss-1) TaxID=665079 RepID=A7E647_SCLS1|nr:hypothetical protein SS1G_00772 [Sclerotinia sclerotiorum 1980 UF-70]EDN91369.1 hypothetical protein SS1G_00772 [Sclerotinia sclerotiorum 1980 UF-70]
MAIGSHRLIAALLAISHFANSHFVPHPTSQRHERDTDAAAAFTGFSIFSSGSLSSLNLTSTCEAALYQTVYCDDDTSSLLTDGYVDSFDNSTEEALFCDAGCESSIAKLHDSVLAACGDTEGLLEGLPFLGIVDEFWSNWNQSCFTDPTTGENCNAAFSNVTDLSDIPISDLCSYCNVHMLEMMQADAYTDVYNDNWVTTYQYVADACNLTVADFNATASAFNVTGVISTTTNCVSGITYTTVEGDTCDSIALAKGVSAATMYYINSDINNCSSVTVGATLCLPLTCTDLYTVQENDTCTSIAVNAGLLTANVISYNSHINWNCSNLHSTDPYWGSTLCVSTPGGTYTGQAMNTTATSDVAVSAPAGSTVALNSTTDCGEWYANDGSSNLTCAQICLSYEIAINLFTEANTSLNKTTCDNDLVLGNAYCVDPLTGWDWTATASSSSSSTTSTAPSSTSIVTAPGPTQTGITSACNNYYVTVDGDSCSSIETAYDITLAQFYAWNPAIGSDCTNLWLEEAYCVGVYGSTVILALQLNQYMILPGLNFMLGILRLGVIAQTFGLRKHTAFPFLDIPL